MEDSIYRPLSDEERSRIIEKLRRLLDVLPEGADRRGVEGLLAGDIGTRRKICVHDVPWLKGLFEQHGIR